MNISITVDDAAARALLSRVPRQVDVAMRAAIEDGSTLLLARVKRYPAARQGQVYVRTRTLARSWSKTPIAGTGADMVGGVGSNANIAPYNRVVQDRSQQARIHRGRWSTIQDIAEQEAPRVQRFFADRLRAAGLE